MKSQRKVLRDVGKNLQLNRPLRFDGPTRAAVVPGVLFIISPVMKIITKHKDYYDYISGVYGIDEKVVYDRRNHDLIVGNGTSAYFFQERVFDEHLHANDRRPNRPDIIFLMLEVGFIHYKICVTRKLRADGKTVELEYELKGKQRVLPNERFSQAPIAIGQLISGYNFRLAKSENQVSKDFHIANPTLSDTPIPGIIPAEDIWNQVYEYISWTNEKPISDNRTDVEHAESHGFDKRISFRHRKP